MKEIQRNDILDRMFQIEDQQKKRWKQMEHRLEHLEEMLKLILVNDLLGQVDKETAVDEDQQEFDLVLIHGTGSAKLIQAISKMTKIPVKHLSLDPSHLPITVMSGLTLRDANARKRKLEEIGWIVRVKKMNEELRVIHASQTGQLTFLNKGQPLIKEGSNMHSNSTVGYIFSEQGVKKRIRGRQGTAAEILCAEEQFVKKGDPIILVKTTQEK